jgi:hypothetical protein
MFENDVWVWFGFQTLLTLDDDLAYTPHDEIPVF